MHLIFNERTKLTASWINTLATALIAAGALAPTAAFFHGLSIPSVGVGVMVAVVLGCFVLGTCPTFGCASSSWEIARMNALEIMAFVAPVLAAIVVTSVGLLAVWFDLRAERRKAR
jgi:hypothetical protein